MKCTFIKQSIPAMACATFLSAVTVPADAVLVTRNMSGLWDLPDHERHGMTITVTQLESGEKSVVSYLATYDNAGNPTWFAAQGSVDGDTISGPLYRVSGPGFLDPSGSPSTFEVVGEMQVEFSDCDHAFVSFQTPTDVIGTGGFYIQRISNLYQTDCTGGVTDDTPTGTTPTEFEIFLDNTGLDADASGEARFEETLDRTEFSVEVEDLDVGVYELFIGGEKRADIEVETRPSGTGTKGEVEFSSPEEPGELPLTFDPRGMPLEVSQNGDVYLTADLPVEGDTPEPPGDGDVPPFGNTDIEVDLVNQGVIAEASGDAELEQRGARIEFKVEIEDVPVGDYPLFVDGVERATISVVDTPGGPEGDVEFRFPGSPPGKIPLDFDPRGTLVDVQQDGVSILSVDFPTMGPNDNDGNNGVGDDNNGNNGNGGNGNGGNNGSGSSTRFDVTVGFTNEGVDPDAEGEVEYESNGQVTTFEVEVEDLDAGTYELVVGSDSVAMIFASGNGRSRLVFRDPVRPNTLPLDFDPLGQTVSVVQDGTVYLSLTMPTP